jgi:hypothetical protein
MRVLLVVLSTLLLVLNFEARSECSARIEFSPNGEHAFAVYDLMDHYEGYDKTQLLGEIVHIQYDADTGAKIIGFALESDDGLRVSVSITHDECVPSMTSADQSWLPHIIRKDNRVRVDAYITGSGGFIEAKNVIVLSDHQ